MTWQDALLGDQLGSLTGVACWHDRSGTADLDDIARLHVDLVLDMLGTTTQDGAEVRFRDCTLPELQWFHQLIDRASDRSDG